MSIGFYLVALSLFLNKKKKKSFIFMLLAILSHTSSIIFIPLIILHKIISRKKNKYFNYNILIIASYSFSWIIKEYSYLAGNYQHYITGEKCNRCREKKIGYICLLLLIYFYTLSIRIKNKNNIYFFNIFVIFVILYILLMDFWRICSLELVTFYFLSSYILFSSTLLKNKNLRLLQLLAIILFGLSMFYTTLLSS
ncbi:Uncharacterised protein [Proteus mirabilis]|uniref:Wzy n=1 Tax=Proteus mirabilis TaxID=584 RepID=A0A2X2BIX2_PROMI|nr:Uncharacterised protein [Proteus mirabilis]